MISVPFELEEVEFGILIPAIPLPEKSQKEYGLDRKCEKRKDDIKSSFKAKSFNPLDRQLEEKFNLSLKEYKIMCNSKSPRFGTFE